MTEPGGTQPAAGAPHSTGTPSWQQGPPWQVRSQLIDGVPREAEGAEVIQSVDPATGQSVGSAVAATGAEVERAVAAARAAGPGWRARSAGERAATLRAAAAAVRADAERLARLHTRDTGRLLRDARAAVDAAAGLLCEAAEHGPLDAGRALGGGPGAVDLVRREPRGVVALITPWNDPYPAAAGLLAAALVTGNTVVHKPSERSPLAGRAFAELVATAVPPGVLNVLSGGAATGALIVAHPDVDVVAHVGSSAAGEAIATAAGPRAVRLLLENGGKDALIVDRDVDVAWAAGQAARGAFTNAGQLCVSVERMLVHRDVAAAFLDALVLMASAWAVGDPADDATRLGPLVDERAVAGVLAQLDDAVRRGATVLCGGGRADRRGCYLNATVVSDCTEEMSLWTEETFGPVAAVRRVSSFEQALEEAGRSGYGLAATVLTGSMAHALAAVDALEVGTVKVNDVFGGAPGGSADPRRRSGTGRGYGPDLIGELTTLKTVHLAAPAR
ncbi:MAG TPA: aldehyde dehydrogenase family protein [Kineosporiaceae bacterium]